LLQHRVDRETRERGEQMFECVTAYPRASQAEDRVVENFRDFRNSITRKSDDQKALAAAVASE